jgi:ribonuclease III
LEFLGDSVLNCAIASLIFARFPEMAEGDMSRLRSNLVNQSVLAEIATTLNVGGLLSLGDGEIKTGGAMRPSILADALEAMLGAVFLDGGFDGFESTRSAVESLFGTRLNEVQANTPSKDSKTALQEWCQAKRMSLPQYTVIRIEGEAHRQFFYVRGVVTKSSPKLGAKPNAEVLAEVIEAEGQGNNRRVAEQDAAKQILSLLVSNAPITVATPTLPDSAKSADAAPTRRRARNE